MPTSARVRQDVEARLRLAIQDAGLDPMTRPAEFRNFLDTLASEIWIDHGGEAGEKEQLDIARDLHQAIAGFGPLQPFFDDPTIEEVWLNEPGRIFIARKGKSELTTVVLNEREVRDLVERMLRASGRRIDISSPFVDAVLPDGSRLHVVIPDITRRHWAVNIRRFVLRPLHVHELVGEGTLSSQAAAFLHASVATGLNIVVAGGTQAGKTTLLNALLGSLSAGERVVSCEEVFELHLAHVDWVALQTRDMSLDGTGEVPLRRLIREALRMRPTRIVVGEVRQGEALDLLIAMNSGMPAMATLHANSAREAVMKLCTLPLLAGQNIPSDFVLPTVASSVDLVVQTQSQRDGSRCVSEIVGLSGRVESGVVELAEIFTTGSSGLERRTGFPPHARRFADAGFDLAALLASSPESQAERAA
ncbi:MAG: ATPase, T2SS/T4P/T4SS family [Actinomycetota bacterium]|nr:ATPase, T2SS/T4P/T4SS family [Actinomycetota bacterium]